MISKASRLLTHAALTIQLVKLLATTYMSLILARSRTAGRRLYARRGPMAYLGQTMTADVVVACSSPAVTIH
jgi:hypothetical protein